MHFPREQFLANAIELNHSTEFITNSIEYIDRLNGNNLPVIFSLQHLAIEMGIQSYFLKYLIDMRSSHYSFYLLSRKDSSKPKREIMAPNEELKYIQRWINYNILQKIEYSTHVQGFVPGSSIKSNAQIHSGAKYLLKIDLLKFFDCIQEKRVYSVFKNMGYLSNLSVDLAKICTSKHRQSYWQSLSAEDKKILGPYIATDPYILPQGAPTSPLLSNLVAQKLDYRISKLSERVGFKYSRYADDLCFSANEKSKIPSIDLIEKIINEEGFFINKGKTAFSRRGTKQYVTGLSVTNSSKVSVSKSKRKEIFSHLYYCIKYGVDSHVTYLKNKGQVFTNFQNWILGNISYHYSIDKSVGMKMFGLYNRINWIIVDNIDQINNSTEVT